MLLTGYYYFIDHTMDDVKKVHIISNYQLK